LPISNRLFTSNNSIIFYGTTKDIRIQKENSKKQNIELNCMLQDYYRDVDSDLFY